MGDAAAPRAQHRLALRRGGELTLAPLPANAAASDVRQRPGARGGNWAYRGPGWLQPTRWSGLWTGRHTGAEGPCWSRSVSGAARTGTSCRKTNAARSLAAARRALIRFSTPVG